MQESSTKPYLLRALHDWCTDHGYTPHIVVQVDENTVVPQNHVHDGQITLNVSYLATNQLLIGNEYIEFQARFDGATEDIFIPVPAVAAIFARETGAGMGFEVTPSEPYPGTQGADQPTPTHSGPQGVTTTPEDTAASDKKPSEGKDGKERPSHLRVIK